MRRLRLEYNLLRDGAFYARLRALQDSAPTLRMNYAGEIKTSLTGEFARLARDADGHPVEFDFLSDEIQPVEIIDGLEHPMGVFSPATPSDVQDGPLASIAVQCYDRCWRVRDTRSAALLYWPAGTRYLDAIEQLLTAAGIRVILATDSPAVFATAREDWELGVSYLTVVNDLLREISYKELYFDADGAAVLEPATPPTAAAVRHVIYAFPAGELPAGKQLREIRRIQPDAIFAQARITRTTDIYEAPNSWIVTCQNPDQGALMAATARNDNPQSPLSIPRRGREITRLVSVNNIPSLAALQAYADKLRNDSLVTGETIALTTALHGAWGVGDAAVLHYGELSAFCVCRAYEIELTVGGQTRLTLERLVYNLDG